MFIFVHPHSSGGKLDEINRTMPYRLDEMNFLLTALQIYTNIEQAEKCTMILVQKY